MNRPSVRLPAPLRWRNLRWILCAAAIPALWACNNRKLANPSGAPSQIVQAKVLQSQNRKLDLLFMIDDSSSMAPLQAKMANRLPDFMASLKTLPGGLPDLHVAIISSSLGAGAYGDVPGCMPGPPGNDDGKFQVKSGCGLNAGDNFIKASADGSTNNFTGQIETVFSCLALLGQGGCGFEHQFESTRVAIIRSLQNPPDATNGGFWRDDAFLGIVMLTNEDDCSVPANSQLFSTAVQSVNDQPPLGGLWSYRCNEFGHKCDQPLPHTAAGLPMTLTGCMSEENTDGLYHLVPEADYVSFLNSVKSPEKLFLAIIAGPATPYTVHARTAQLSTGATEMQPEISHSCMAGDGTYADPGVREVKLVTDMAGVFLPICADDFKPALQQIATAIGMKLGVQCIKGNVTQVNGAPDCDVVLRTTNPTNPAQFTDKPIPYCEQGTTSAAGAPCWSLAQDMACPNAQTLKVCYDNACGPAPMSSSTTNAIVSCAISL